MWRDQVEAVLEDLDSLLAAGSAAEVVDLSELARQGLSDSVGLVDDSDGHDCGLFELGMARHLKACRRVPPDPDVLASKLLRWALEFELDRYVSAVGDEAPVIGEEELTAYRPPAEKRWAEATTLTAGDDPRERLTDRFRIRTVMEYLAVTTGGLDERMEGWPATCRRPEQLRGPARSRSR